MYKTLLARLRWMIVLLFCCTGLTLAAASPVTQLQNVADRMTASLEKNKSRLSDINVIRRIVNQILLPNIDLNRMAASVTGRYWLSATSAQREQFKKEFSYLVTTTYAAALASYDDDRVRFYPIDNFQQHQTMVVRSVIVRKNGRRISVHYQVVRQGSNWKVYDFSIENVSMVQSYRAQFARELASGGMNGMIERLKRHNRSK